MICNLTDLNTALDWFERNDLKLDSDTAVPVVGWETVHYRGWLIERHGRNPFRIAMRGSMPEAWAYGVVAPWVVDELKRKATEPI